MDNLKKLPHILLSGTAHTENYVSPLSGRDNFRLPPRNRQNHGKKLIDKIRSLEQEQLDIIKQQKALGVEAGLYLQFESDPGFNLHIEGLEFRKSGIELLNVKQIESVIYATIFIPEGKLKHFIDRFTKYISENTNKNNNPKYQKLVESISDIHKAILKALWTDAENEFPNEGIELWWEVWLRTGKDREFNLEMFRDYARNIGMQVSEQKIEFLDRTVTLVYGNREQMSQSMELLNVIAELRKAKETAEFFVKLSPSEQGKWVYEALERISPPGKGSPAICILDTGVNRGHPLLSFTLNDEDMHTYNPEWGVNDHLFHGTEMAGLAIYGDLVDIFTSTEPLSISHRLESVKILPPHNENPHELYGAMTEEAVSRVNVTAPLRKRLFSMAVTTDDFRDRGKPSSWSASIDKICSGFDNGERQLFVVSAGNTNMELRSSYPDSNLSDTIHDPGQSWNAITVGAYTEKAQINSLDFRDWRPLAPHGDISPSSCTSLTWESQWPIKPDIVLEGGNMAVNPDNKEVDYTDSLQLLTTNWQPAVKLLVTTGDTSAATALAARMAAIIQAQYPRFWPETLRALLIHSANWTNAMIERYPGNKKRDKENLLRYTGFGVPALYHALWSAQDCLTLIAQDELQPFTKEGSDCKTCDINLHAIPWPVEVLQSLGEIDVKMRVTLSYFIEPNPGRKGWGKKHRYASHGLRFEVKKPTENDLEFKCRVNKAARDEDSDQHYTSNAEKWFLGPALRKQGSIHSDIWKGPAVELASMSMIAVFPVSGWWKERPHLGRWVKKARYSLVVTIETPKINVDIYTPVINQIKTITTINIE